MRTAAAAKPGAGLPSHPRAGSSVPAPQPLGLAAGSPWAPVPAPSAPLACKLLTHPGPGTSEPAQAAILPGSLPAPALTGKESSAPAPAAQRGAGPTIHLHPKLIQHFPVPLPRFQPPRAPISSVGPRAANPAPQTRPQAPRSRWPARSCASSDSGTEALSSPLSPAQRRAWHPAHPCPQGTRLHVPPRPLAGTAPRSRHRGEVPHRRGAPYPRNATARRTLPSESGGSPRSGGTGRGAAGWQRVLPSTPGQGLGNISPA